jgi:hypothetical protein
MADQLKWRKSKRSANGEASCVEVARVPGSRQIATRDSKAPNDGMLRFRPQTFSVFLGDVKRGRYDW